MLFTTDYSFTWHFLNVNLSCRCYTDRCVSYFNVGGIDVWLKSQCVLLWPLYPFVPLSTLHM